MGDIEDYRYYENNFLNSIAGSENLRAYSQETNLARRDEPMTEAGYYVQDTSKNQIYLNEGPGYVEVGFDEVFEKETLNSARRLNEAQGSDSVTLYNYQPSKVEYYTYRELYV